MHLRNLLHANWFLSLAVSNDKLMWYNLVLNPSLKLDFGKHKIKFTTYNHQFKGKTNLFIILIK